MASSVTYTLFVGNIDPSVTRVSDDMNAIFGMNSNLVFVFACMFSQDALSALFRRYGQVESISSLSSKEGFDTLASYAVA